MTYRAPNKCATKPGRGATPQPSSITFMFLNDFGIIFTKSSSLSSLLNLINDNLSLSLFLTPAKSNPADERNADWCSSEVTVLPLLTSLHFADFAAFLDSAGYPPCSLLAGDHACDGGGLPRLSQGATLPRHGAPH